MAFDGITIAALAKELKEELIGSRIYKIAQPENDELLLTLKTLNRGQRRLLISAGASLPLVYLTEINKQSPMTAPGFCMLLRKHLQNGRITDIIQPGLERILEIHIEHLNELGDLCCKRLVIEIMGKHSNIIFMDDKHIIIDSIKHISGMISSVREVLPGRTYFIPKTQDKLDPLTISQNDFILALTHKAMPVYKALYGSFTGISPMIAQEICYEAGIDGDCSTELFSESAGGMPQLHTLWQIFEQTRMHIMNGCFSFAIIYQNKEPIEFAALPLTMYARNDSLPFSSISALLEQYYSEKNAVTRIRQRSIDLRKIVQTALERNNKKYDLQLKQMADTEKKDTYKIYGELLNTYGYNLEPNATSLEALNYYDNQMITIPLNPLLTPSENAKKFFDKYGKMKRTYEALMTLTASVKDEIDHLESIQSALDIALLEEDLVQIKEELIVSGYIRRKGGGKREKITSKPFHYISRDGFPIYVGKNNFQNEELTFKLATGNDWWFHAKGIPGSHVIVKSNDNVLPDSTFEEAARLAAYYSKGRGLEKVEVDYIQKKHVKKPSGGKPGFVIYHTNYSMMIDSDITEIQTS